MSTFKQEFSQTMKLFSLVSSVCLFANIVRMAPFYTYSDYSPPATIDVYITAEEEELKDTISKENYPKYLPTGYKDRELEHFDVETLMRQYLQRHFIKKKQMHDEYYLNPTCKCILLKLIIF